MFDKTTAISIHHIISKVFFSPQLQCRLTVSCTELQMLLKCCSIHKTIIILRPLLVESSGIVQCVHLQKYDESLRMNINYLMKKKNFHLFYKGLLNKKSLIYCDPKQKIFSCVFISKKLTACISTTWSAVLYLVWHLNLKDWLV